VRAVKSEVRPRERSQLAPPPRTQNRYTATAYSCRTRSAHRPSREPAPTPAGTATGVGASHAFGREHAEGARGAAVERSERSRRRGRCLQRARERAHPLRAVEWRIVFAARARSIASARFHVVAREIAMGLAPITGEPTLDHELRSGAGGFSPRSFVGRYRPNHASQILALVRFFRTRRPRGPVLLALRPWASCASQLSPASDARACARSCSAGRFER